MQSNRKRLAVIAAALALLLLVLAAAAGFSGKDEASVLHRIMASYREGGAWNSAGVGSFPENSAEWLFLTGMESFAADDYDSAKGFFEAAQGAPDSDPALPAYLPCYLNQCVYSLEGAGDIGLVSTALEAIGGYPPLANDRELLWQLMETVSFSPDTDAQAISMMEGYLAGHKNLEPATRAWLKNYVAMLLYYNEEYAAGIRGFYDVQIALENAGDDPGILEELRYAKEYIANIYYIFEDHEQTVALYQELIDSVLPEDPDAAYSYLINQGSAWLELSDTENARAAMDKLRALLPELDAGVAAEVEASMNDVLANVYIEEGDYTAALEHLLLAEGFYRENTPAAFLGSEHFVTLTRAKYLTRTGELQDAQELLEEMLRSEEISYYGLEGEVLELLQDVYRQTGQVEQLAGVLERTLELEEERQRTTQREYLEFSEYYRTAIRLEESNTRLWRVVILSILLILAITAVLVAVLLLVRRLRLRNVTDQLTGVYNRKMLSQLTARYSRSGTPADFGVVMMDIDYFKRYNDTYGHPAGDAVLREVAEVLKRSVRKSDFVIRYGGEEFLALLCDVGIQTAQEICERIHKQLRERGIPHEASDAAPHVTLSMGLCWQRTAGGASLEALIQQADGCLYQSKEDGRNRVTVKEAESEERKDDND